MPRKALSLSIQELRRQLAMKERQLGKLTAKREKLAARLSVIDAAIVAMGGEVPVVARRGRPRRAWKLAAAAPAHKGRRRRAGGRPLAEYVIDVLKRAKGGMRVKDVMAAVRQTDYATKSKDFYGIVAAALRDDPTTFKKLRRGVYTLA